MSRLNFRAWMERTLTHEGAPAALHLTIERQLRRSVLSCLLWEKEFYEDGVSIADRIVALAEQAPPELVAALAFEARSAFNLRHVPLLLIAVLAKTGAGTRLVRELVGTADRALDRRPRSRRVWQRRSRSSTPTNSPSTTARTSSVCATCCFSVTPSRQTTTKRICGSSSPTTS
ncbi:MAG TPA: hypothetical protein VLX67_04715 [Stellaceae bacterium]|nr:hypothetical protein [Stellaceae bacterium]